MYTRLSEKLYRHPTGTENKGTQKETGKIGLPGPNRSSDFIPFDFIATPGLRCYTNILVER